MEPWSLAPTSAPASAGGRKLAEVGQRRDLPTLRGKARRSTGRRSTVLPSPMVKKAMSWSFVESGAWRSTSLREAAGHVAEAEHIAIEGRGALGIADVQHRMVHSTMPMRVSFGGRCAGSRAWCGLDLEDDLYLVTNDHTAAVDRHLEIDAEVLPADLGVGREADAVLPQG